MQWAVLLQRVLECSQQFVCLVLEGKLSGSGQLAAAL
jgi:hypothetical protein